MTVFDLVFLLFSLGSLVTLALVGVRALRGGSVARLCRRLLFAWLAYAVALLGVSVLSPQRVVSAGTPQCSDDWCLTLAGVVPASPPTGLEYVAHLDLTNRGRGRAQRERFVSVYLVGADGSRVGPVADPNDVPFDTLVAAGQVIRAIRRFRLPAEMRPVALIVTREGGGRFPGCCIIGNENSFLHKPTLLSR